MANKDKEIKELKERIEELEERRYTNKEVQLKKIAEIFGEEAFIENGYEYTDPDTKEKKYHNYKKPSIFYERLSRLGNDGLIDLKKKILKFTEVSEKEKFICPQCDMGVSSCLCKEKSLMIKDRQGGFYPNDTLVSDADEENKVGGKD